MKRLPQVEPLRIQTPSDREREAQEADAAYTEKSRQFRITEADVTGERNKLFDEEN